MKKSVRSTGLTRDTGYQIGVRRTLPVSAEDAWRLVTSKKGVAAWLGRVDRLRLASGARYTMADGTTGEVRVFSAGSHLRLTYHPPAWKRASTIQVRVIPGRGSTVIAFHQEHLPGSRHRESRRAHFRQALDELAGLIRGGTEGAAPSRG